MKVALFTLGGTIASTSTAGGVAPQLAGADLLASIPGLDRAGTELQVHDFRQLPSSSLAVDDLLELAHAIRQQIGQGADGVVVSQGTDTIEETAFLLDLLWDGDAPVVFTGAMRNPTLAGADGPGQPAGRGGRGRQPAGPRSGVRGGVRRRDPRRAIRAEGPHDQRDRVHQPAGRPAGRHRRRPRRRADPAAPLGRHPRSAARPAGKNRAGHHGPRRRRDAARGRGRAVRRAGGSRVRGRARARGGGRPAGRSGPAHPGRARLADRGRDGAGPHVCLPGFRARPAAARPDRRRLPGPAQGPAAAAPAAGRRRQPGRHRGGVPRAGRGPDRPP